MQNLSSNWDESQRPAPLPLCLKSWRFTISLSSWHQFHNAKWFFSQACLMLFEQSTALSATCSAQMHRLAQDRLLWISLLQDISGKVCHKITVCMLWELWWLEYLQAWADLFVQNICTVNCSQLTLLVYHLRIVYWCQMQRRLSLSTSCSKRMCDSMKQWGIAVYCASYTTCYWLSRSVLGKIAVTFSRSSWYGEHSALEAKC